VSGLDLLPHQAKALAELSNGKALRSDPGAGKTYVGVAYYQQNEMPRDVYVITTAKKRNSLDWEEVFAKIGIGSNKGRTTGGTLTVDSWNNLPNYRDVKNAFFIFDEQRTVGSGAWAKSFIRVARANRWILLTATPGDTWMDYAPLFIANEFYRNRTEFLQEHVVYNTFTKFPKVERYRNVTRLEIQRQHILVEMPFARHTNRIVQPIKVSYNKELMRKAVDKRWNVFEDRPIREVSELFSVMRRIVNSDPSRIKAVRKLMRQHPSLIVFYNFDYELESLRTGLGGAGDRLAVISSGKKADLEQTLLTTQKRLALVKGDTSGSMNSQTSTLSAIEPQSSKLTIAEYNGHKHEDVPTEEPWVYLVQYTAGAEAWDCISTNAMLLYSLQYSYKIQEQAYGRIDRLNTTFTDLYYYVLMSDAKIDQAIWKALREKRNFNESSRKDMPGSSLKLVA
jgi:hypothetical protein